MMSRVILSEAIIETGRMVSCTLRCRPSLCYSNSIRNTFMDRSILSTNSNPRELTKFNRSAILALLTTAIITACGSLPGINVPVGYVAGVEYPNTFTVVKSETGPPKIQRNIAEALSEVLRTKGLQESNTPGVIFSLHWSGTDGICEESSPEQPCENSLSTYDQPVIFAHLRLDAHSVSQGTLIWEADFRGIRRIPIKGPSREQILEIFVPAFTEALAEYPVNN